MTGPIRRDVQDGRLGGHGKPVPTGMALVALIRLQGRIMLDSTTREQYVAEKDLFLQLLQIADHDAIAGPMLAVDVQRVLDEESARFRAGQYKG